MIDDIFSSIKNKLEVQNSIVCLTLHKTNNNTFIGYIFMVAAWIWHFSYGITNVLYIYITYIFNEIWLRLLQKYLISNTEVMATYLNIQISTDVMYLGF